MMNKILLIILLFPLFVLAQNDSLYCKKLNEDIENIPLMNTMYNIPEDAPVFIESLDSLINLINNPPYPRAAMENKIEGKIHVRFIVDTNGFPHCFEIPRGDSLGFGCEDAAIKYLKSLNMRFTPGVFPSRSGKKIPVKLVLPVTFSLKNVKKEE